MPTNTIQRYIRCAVSVGRVGVERQRLGDGSQQLQPFDRTLTTLEHVCSPKPAGWTCSSHRPSSSLCLRRVPRTRPQEWLSREMEI